MLVLQFFNFKYEKFVHLENISTKATFSSLVPYLSLDKIYSSNFFEKAEKKKPSKLSVQLFWSRYIYICKISVGYTSHKLSRPHFNRNHSFDSIIVEKSSFTNFFSEYITR